MEKIQIIQYTADDILQMSSKIEKKVGYKPTFLQVQEVLRYYSEKAYPAFEVTGHSMFEEPFRLVFEMRQAKKKHVN